MNYTDFITNFEQLLSNDKKTETVLLEFEKLPNYSDKVKFIENLLIKYELLPIKEVPLTIEKNNEKSINLRERGDECFALKTPTKLYEALEFYNESIAFAECDTENLSLCYENRSEIYFELKMYDACLENIQLAKLKRSRDSSIEKLIEHELICKNETKKPNKNDNKIVYTPELSYPPHEKVPFIANCLELCEDKQYGRYIKTNIDLEPGKIIAIEKPFATMLEPSKQFTCCANCLSENSLNLIPCLQCTSAMFCNEKCRTEALNNFHKYECPIINYLFKTFQISSLNALRLTIKAILAFKSTEKLMAFTQDTNKNDINAFTLNYDDISEEQKYYPIHALATNEDKRSTDDLFDNAIGAAVMYHYICKYTPLKENLKTTDDQNIFVHLLYKHIMTVRTNSHLLDMLDLSETLKTTPYDSNSELSFSSPIYGSVTCALFSLFNHSCAANVGRTTFNTDMVIFVTKSIKSGEQLFDNYGYDYYSAPKDERKNELLTHYYFQCECIACNNNYPLYDDIVDNEIDKLAAQINIVTFDYKIKSSFKKEIAFASIEKSSNLLKKYSNHPHPSKLVYEVQGNLFMSYEIVFDKISFRLQLFVNNE